MWELDCEEGWEPKNWCFWIVVLEKTLESPLDCKEIQPVYSEEISPGISLEGMMLKLKLQYFGHLMQRVDSLEKSLMLGGIEGRRRRGRQRMRWLDGITDWWTWVWVNSGSWGWTGKPGVLRFMGSQRVRHDCATELNWSWGKVKINTMPIHRAKETCNWDFNPEGSDSWAWALNTCYSAANL